jgi:hypothetical protein
MFNRYTRAAGVAIVLYMPLVILRVADVNLPDALRASGFALAGFAVVSACGGLVFGTVAAERLWSVSLIGLAAFGVSVFI